MRQRNPDMEAYRTWQSDRKDRGALQRYLLSMDRGQEILDDPEQIVELDEAVSLDKLLRPIYDRVRPDYSNSATPFREERWRTLVDRYTGQQLDPQAVLILVEMGLRSGVSMEDVYRILHERQFIDDEIYKNIYGIRDGDRHCAWELYDAEQDAASAVPQLIDSMQNSSNRYIRRACAETLGKIIKQCSPYVVSQIADSLENDYDDQVRYYCAVSLGRLGPYAASAVDQLMDSLKDDQDWSVRYYCAEALGKIGLDAASAIHQLIDSLQNDPDWQVRSSCAVALGKIEPFASSTIDQLIDSLENEQYQSVRYHCVKSLGQMGPSAASSVSHLMKYLQNDQHDSVSRACHTAIEQITGEAPQ